MEYGASAEDIARVCHAHPVSIMDLLIVTVCDNVGEGMGVGILWWISTGGYGNRQSESRKKYSEGRRGRERGRGMEGGRGGREGKRGGWRERVMLRLFLSFRRVQRL